MLGYVYLLTSSLHEISFDVSQQVKVTDYQMKRTVTLNRITYLPLFEHCWKLLG